MVNTLVAIAVLRKHIRSSGIICSCNFEVQRVQRASIAVIIARSSAHQDTFQRQPIPPSCPLCKTPNAENMQANSFALLLQLSLFLPVQLPRYK